MDIYVRQALKNWTVNNPAPASRRARLMLVAAATPQESAFAETGEPRKTPFALISPIDQAMQIYSLPWVWVAHVTLTPIRRVT